MKISHQFVELIPETLDQRVVYISIKYRTASHLCMCGCGNKVVTPIRPERWQLSYDGQSVSLFPSIGNWGLPCQSHYWIEKDTVKWSYKMSDSEIRRVKARQAQRVHDYYDTKELKHRFKWLKKQH